jgi:hypothetical protein
MCAETLQSTQDSGARQSLLPRFTDNPFVKRDTFVFVGFANKILNRDPSLGKTIAHLT